MVLLPLLFVVKEQRASSVYRFVGTVYGIKAWAGSISRTQSDRHKPYFNMSSFSAFLLVAFSAAAFAGERLII